MIRALFKDLLHFVFPPYCLHCESPLSEGAEIFCFHCLSLMQLINSAERCPCCFGPSNRQGNVPCSSCCETPPLWHKAGAALDYEGPAVSLITAMKYGNQPYLAKGAGAFMASQLTHLNWPFPDLIVPVPIPLTRWMQRGYNQSGLLAQTLGSILQRPVVDLLKRRSGDYSQAGLSSKQRRELTSASFYLKGKGNFEDKTLLLVDDVMTTGSTLKCCTEVLLEKFPKSIYVLTVCRSMQ